MNPVDIQETEDFPSPGISLRRRNSASKGLQLDTDAIDMDDNPYTKKIPQTPMVKMRDPMNDLNEMNYLKSVNGFFHFPFSAFLFLPGPNTSDEND